MTRERRTPAKPRRSLYVAGPPEADPQPAKKTARKRATKKATPKKETGS